MEKTERGRGSDEGTQRNRETTEEKERVKAKNHKWMMRLMEDQNRQEKNKTKQKNQQQPDNHYFCVHRLRTKQK